MENPPNMYESLVLNLSKNRKKQDNVSRKRNRLGQLTKKIGKTRKALFALRGFYLFHSELAGRARQ